MISICRASGVSEGCELTSTSSQIRCYTTAAVVRILHISDPHAESESMSRLENLARAQADCNVVALTGDCVSQSCHHVPGTWNDWPQSLLLAVPGNHDKPDTFKDLGSWQFQTPYAARFDELTFMGLRSLSVDEMTKALEANGCRDWEGCRGVVVLCHYGPGDSKDGAFADAIRERLGCTALLFLHGHERPRDFDGTEWCESVTSTSTVFRSRVCSSVSRCRGLGHRIEWDGRLFRRTVVQGSPNRSSKS